MAAAEEGRAPARCDGGGEAVFAGVAFHAGPVEVEARPGAQQDGGAESHHLALVAPAAVVVVVVVETQRGDFGVRVQDVGEDADG